MLQGPSKVKRIPVSINDVEDDITLFQGDDITPDESIQPMVSQLEPLRLKGSPQVTLIKEIDLWILSLDGEINDSAISGIIDMATGDYRNYMEEHFKAFPYIDSLAIKKIRDAQAAADWVNSKILIASMQRRQGKE